MEGRFLKAKLDEDAAIELGNYPLSQYGDEPAQDDLAVRRKELAFKCDQGIRVLFSKRETSHDDATMVLPPQCTVRAAWTSPPRPAELRRDTFAQPSFQDKSWDVPWKSCLFSGSIPTSGAKWHHHGMKTSCLSFRRRMLPRGMVLYRKKIR